MRGLAPGPANKTLEALRILFMFAALEGAAGLLLPRLLPWGGRMNATKRSSGRPIVMAFVIWFAHFMVLWAGAEIWPHQWAANALAWVVTAIALLAVGVHSVRLKAQHAEGCLSGWNYRFARGAAAIAAAAVVFTALPSVVFLP